LLTDPNGAGTVKLTAPTSSPATFTVRAAVGTMTATATVSVQPSASYAKLTVAPRYAGVRKVSSWIAGAHVGKSCAELGDAPGDGNVSAESMEQPQITPVPVSAPVAVSLRAAQFAFGCTDIGELKAGAVRFVDVEAFDRPLRLDASFLVNLQVDTVSPSWTEALQPAIDAASQAVVGSAIDDAGALLDQMQALAPLGDESTESFQTRRAYGNWDESLLYPPVALRLTGMKASEVRSKVASWMQQAAAHMPSPSVLSGRLDPATDPSGPNRASFSPLGFAGVNEPEAAGFSARGPTEVSWLADPKDAVALGAMLPWWPTRLLGTLARGIALSEQPTAATVEAALALAVDCRKVATILVQAGSSGGLQGTESYPGCNLECTELLCQNGISKLWKAAVQASPQALLGIDASAPAVVDDQARATAFRGTWVGKVYLGSPSSEIAATVTGSASGSPP
jgi:hypothetical protein